MGFGDNFFLRWHHTHTQFMSPEKESVSFRESLSNYIEFWRRKKNVLDRDLKWMWLVFRKKGECERDKVLPIKGINVIFMQQYVDALNQRKRERERKRER